VFCFYCEPGLKKFLLSRQFFKIRVFSLGKNICKELDFSDEYKFIGIFLMSTVEHFVQKVCSALSKEMG